MIIGGGIAGLTAALRFTQAGWDVALLEARDEFGGLARSMPLGGGRIERYYHFICGGDAALLELANELGLQVHWRPAPVGHWYRGRLYPLSTAFDILRFGPLPFVDRLRVGIHAWRAQRTSDWAPLDAISAKQWLLGAIGPRAYEAIWRPLLETKFGPYADQISAAWLWHRLWRVGTSRKSPLRPDIMGHFAGGSDALISALVDRIGRAGGQLRTNCPARRVVGSGGGLMVETDNGDVEARAVLLAVPLPVAADLTRELAPELAGALRKVAVIGVVCALLRLPRHLSRYFWLNINDERIAYNGVIEYSNLNPSAELWGGEVAYIPFYLPTDDERFSWGDEKWRELFLDGVAVMAPELAGEVEVVAITRDAYAQPICDVGFSRRVPPIATPVPGVFLVEASQLYPSDRCLSGMIELAGRAVDLAISTR